MVIKLKEITQTLGTGEFEDAAGLDSDEVFDTKYNNPIAQIDGKNIKVKLDNYTSEIKKFKEYRFLVINKNLAIHGDASHTLIMILPDRDFIIGYIAYDEFNGLAKFKDKQIEVASKIIASAIHRKFRRQGLGKIMYKYFTTIYDIIQSDEQLYPGSFNMWTNVLVRDFGGILCANVSYAYEFGLHIYPLSKKISGIEGKKNRDLIREATNFVYMSNSKYLEKHGYKYNKTKERWI